MSSEQPTSNIEHNDESIIATGSIVRAPRPSRRHHQYPASKTTKKKYTGRAVVMTTHGSSSGSNHDKNDDALTSILWEDIAPQCLLHATILKEWTATKQNSSRRGRLLNRKFLITPEKRIDEDDDKRKECQEEEDDVPLSSLRPLLPFERKLSSTSSSPSLDSSDSSSSKDNTDTLVKRYKSYGDEFYKLGDVSAAAEYYEVALALTSLLSIGGTVIINKNGRPALAEVDCINDDENTMDITYDESDDEETVHEKQILLCIMEDDDDDDQDTKRIQERILLNLSRCMMNIAEIISTPMCSIVERTRAVEYYKAAVLGCTLAISCCAHHDEGKKKPYLSSTDSQDKKMATVATMSTEEKARIIRAKAYMETNKVKHATLDLRHVLTRFNPNNKEATQLLKELEQRELQRKKTDKKLAKDVCKWVQHATEGGSVDGNESSIRDKAGERDVWH